MKPVKPIITEFEEVILPEDETTAKSKDFSVEDLSSVFNQLNISGNQLNQSDSKSSTKTLTSTEAELKNAYTIAEEPSEKDDANSGTTQAKDTTYTTDSTDSTNAQSVVCVPQRDDGECPVSAESIFESVLFVGNTDNEGYVSTDSICKLMPGVTEEDVVAIADRVANRWVEDSRPYRLECREGTQWRMVLDPKFEPVRDGFYTAVREFELPQSAINVLGVLMYLQPMTAQEVAKKVGIDHPIPIFNQLVKRNLLQVEQRITETKKVNLYRTTQRFLDFFGLESLDDLPTCDEV